MTFEKADEMDCLVRGCNFLQTSVPREAFHFRNGSPTYLDKGLFHMSAHVVAQQLIAGQDGDRTTYFERLIPSTLQQMEMSFHTFLSILGQASAS